MRSVGRWLTVVMAVGCEPSGSDPPGVPPDAAPGDLGATPGDALADVADVAAASEVGAALDAQPPDVAGDAAEPADRPAADGDVADGDVADGDAPDAPDAPCAVGLVPCDGACVDPSTSRAHCGACGRRCAAGERCVAASCQALTQRSCAGAERPGCGMAVIDGGRFTIGTPTQCFSVPDATCGYSAAPTQTDLAVGRFAVDLYEVTVARFNAYWSVREREMSAVRGAPLRYRGGELAWPPAPNAEPTRQSRDYNWLPASSTRDAHPINGVDYWMAQEFCAWDGGRLPTEAEWEYVARAGARDGLAAGRVYPWGDDAPTPSCDRARWSNTTCPAGDDGARTVRVGRYPTGAAGGVHDLAGNVWEWVADNFTSYSGSGAMGACENRSGAVDPLCLTGIDGDSRVIRGGGWGDTSVANLRAATRGSFNPALRSFIIGFRCARDVPP